MSQPNSMDITQTYSDENATPKVDTLGSTVKATNDTINRQMISDVDNVTSHDESKDEQYQQLKRKLQLVLDENERIANELERASRSISKLRREKRLLLDRLLKCRKKAGYDSSSEEEPLPEDTAPTCEPQFVRVNRSMLAKQETSASLHNISPEHTTQSGSAYASEDALRTMTAYELKSGTASPTTSLVKTMSGGGGRPRRNRRVITEVRKVHPIPRDIHGAPVLPIQIGILTLINLGQIVFDRDTFHNERYIWPVGYTVKRPYASMRYPDRQTIYTCTVRDGIDGPKVS
jgi:hypothetical protein